MPTAPPTAFRVLVIGGRQRVEYALLRSGLDKLLANRLPAVEVLTAGGPGVPALAACYARERMLKLTAVTLDCSSHRGDAAEWRAQRLAELADAAVLVGAATEVRPLLDAVLAKGLRVAVLTGRAEPEEPAEAEAAPEYRSRWGGPPD